MFSKTHVPSFLSLLVLLSIPYQTVQAQFKILLYTETGGFNHGTAQVTKVLLDSLGTAHNFTVDHDTNGDTFDSLDSLNTYEIVLWANTSGSNILTAAQQSNFENYMLAGGNMMGIHAATDTYRHSTANGSWKGHWDWYAETLGASVQSGPNHTDNHHNNFLDHQASHAAIDSLPSPWEHAEEYYYWENGYYDSLNNQVLLQVRQTEKGGVVNSYDAARAIAWIKDHIGGGRIFYTALGHNRSSYEDDLHFKVHIRDAILALSAPPTVLPIQWEDVWISQHERSNMLQWTVKQDLLQGRFIVERRSFGQLWEQIGHVDLEASPAQASYAFVDNSPASSKLYYRIAFENTNGDVMYSQVLESIQNVSETWVHNPLTDMLEIHVQNDIQGLYQIELFNFSGARVFQKSFQKDAYKHHENQKISEIPPGIYFLKISAKDFNFAHTIWKQ